MKEADNSNPYFREAKEKYGSTKQWKQSQNVDQATIDQARVATKEFAEKLAEAKAAGVEPGSSKAAALVLAHRKSIGGFYEVTPERQLILARMYTQDERFNETYLGNAEYLLTLIEHHVGVENPSWD